MSLTFKVIAGVLWSAASQVARRGANLLVTIVLARLLSPDAFGLVALATMFVGLVNVLCDLGFSSALVQREEVTDEHLTTAWWLSMMVSVALALGVAAAAAPVAALYHEPRVVPLLRALAVSMPIATAGQVSGVLLQRRLAFRPIAMIDFAGTLTSGAAGIGLALAGFGVWALVGQTLTLSVTTLVGRQVAAPFRPRGFVVVERARELSTFGLTVIGGTLVNFAGTNIDNAIVGGALGTSALGTYALAYNLAVLPGTTVGGLVSGVMFPALSRLQGEPDRLRRGYVRMLRVVSMGTLPLVIGLWASAGTFIPTVYGSKWTEAATVLRHLVLIGLLQGINTSGNIFYALGKPGLILKWAVLSLGCMALALALGVKHGVLGVTTAYTLVAPIVLFGPHLLANRLMALSLIDFARALGPAAIASTLMGASVTLLERAALLPSRGPVALGVLVAVGAFVYGVVLVVIARLDGTPLRGLRGWVLGEHVAAEAGRQ